MNWKPEVGEFCAVEVIHQNRGKGGTIRTYEANIDYLSDEGVVFTDKSGRQWFIDFCLDAVDFRPLKTKEEQQRDEAVKAMCVIAEKGTLWIENICEELYDAGYRKVTPLSDDEIGEQYPESEMEWVDLLMEAKRQGAEFARNHILGGQEDA